MGPGLKILVSAVQSRPCPPLLSGSCPSVNSSRIAIVPRFVPNSGTLQRITAEFNHVSSRPEIEALTPIRESRRLLPIEQEGSP